MIFNMHRRCSIICQNQLNGEIADTIGKIPFWIISTVAGAVTSLTYYNGELYSGHADGSIKTWDIKGQEATPVRDVREHKKIWQMLARRLECIEIRDYTDERSNSKY